MLPSNAPETLRTWRSLNDRAVNDSPKPGVSLSCTDELGVLDFGFWSSSTSTYLGNFRFFEKRHITDTQGTTEDTSLSNRDNEDTMTTVDAPK
jgi:hypothetical protein